MLYTTVKVLDDWQPTNFEPMRLTVVLFDFEDYRVLTEDFKGQCTYIYVPDFDYFNVTYYIPGVYGVELNNDYQLLLP